MSLFSNQLFDEIYGKEPKPLKKELWKELYKYPTVHNEDQLPVNIIKPDLKNGPWIAGGACLRWFQNIPVGEHSDIDVFCKNEKQAENLIDYIKNHLGLAHYHNGHAHVVIKTANACTFNIHANSRDWKVQIITCKYFDTIKEVIDNFDISVCQLATAGNEWILGDNTAKDIHERNLRFNHITKQAPKRLIKYWTYGFNPVEGTIEAIQEHKDSSWDFAGEDDYANTF
jgi:hypothetical protein